MNKPLVISIISRVKNTGKTTLIKGILPILKKKKYKIMTLKFSCYDFIVDYEDTDSYKHFNSGVNRTVLIGPSKTVTFEKTYKRQDFNDVINQYNDVDIIIAEGFRDINYPTIEVVRKEKGSKLCSKIKNLIAIVSDDKNMNFPVSVFGLDEYEKICKHIEESYISKESSNIAR